MSDKSTPAVSIIVPCYNAADTLPDTIASLRNQTFQNWETVCVDDGSEDGVGDYIERLAARDARFRAIGATHAGLAATRNHGISLATSERILPLDADDVLRPDALERLLAASTRCGDAVVVFPGVELLDQRARPLGVFRYPSEANFTLDRLLEGNTFSPTALIPRRLLDDPPYDPTLQACEDWDLWLRLSARGARAIVEPTPLLGYRLRAGSLARRARLMAGEGARVLQKWDHEPGKSNHAARWTFSCAALAAASGSSDIADELLQNVQRNELSCEIVTGAIGWAWQFVGGVDGSTWATHGRAWSGAARAWTRDVLPDELSRDLEHSLAALVVSTSDHLDALVDLVNQRRPTRLLWYGLGHEGVNLLHAWRARTGRPPCQLIAADDFAPSRRFESLNLPRVNLRQWPRWPRDTFAVITPTRHDDLCRALERIGARRTDDFVTLTDLKHADRALSHA